MYRVSQLTVIFIAAMVIFATIGVAVPVAANEPSKPDLPNDTVQTLENDEDLYLIFGVELHNQSIEEFIETHPADEPEQIADQKDFADVIQYQNVDQVNLTQRGSAVSIAIDGGEATAVQKATQQNVHSQTGKTTPESSVIESDKTTFENVGNVYIIFGDSYNQQFKGWGITEKTGENNYDQTQSAAATIVQKTNMQSTAASVMQHQESNQSNYNKQGFVLALAENDSEAVAVQKSKQINQNHQEESADVAGLSAGEDTTEDHVGLSTTKIFEQSQTVAQANENQQGTAIAIAVGSNSSATAIQMTDQSNLNEQSASAKPSKIPTLSSRNIASAVADETSDLSPSSDSTDDSDTTSNVSQSQRTEQNNINLQGAAIAIAINQSNATALQYAEQRNSNNQVSSANVMNIHRGSSSEAHISIINRQSLAVTDNMSQNILEASLAQSINKNQSSSAAIDQMQRIRQENFLQQQTAVAVTKENGSAHATQISIQENENSQSGTLESRNIALGSSHRISD